MAPEKAAKQDWKDRATEAFWKYLDALERDLPPEAKVDEIEQTMLVHYQKMMRETFQALSDRELSPSNTRETADCLHVRSEGCWRNGHR